MKALFWFFIFLFVFLKKIFNYLSSVEFRDLEEINDDFETENYFKYFILNLKYFSNKPLIYMKKCKEGSLYGYFRYGNITNYLSYENYGTLGINLNLIINYENFYASKKDTIDFYLNGNINKRVYLGELRNNTSPPIFSNLCDKQVLIFNLSLIFINNKTTQYSPIELTVSSNVDNLSNIDWGINNIKLYKQACSKKCRMCNNLICVRCEKNMLMKSGVCSCDESNDFFDFNDRNDKIDCRGKY